MLICAICGKKFKPYSSNQCHCSIDCRQKARQAQYRSMTSTSLGHHKKTKWAGKKEALMTDAEQREIDKAVFIKTALTYESKCYKPGDPEWDELVKTITPLDRIPKHRYNESDRIKYVVPSRLPLGGNY